MKIRFAAIDQGGRVVRGVLRADSPEEARDILLEEGLFGKTLEQVAEEEPVTWAPKERIKRRAAGASAGSPGAPQARIVAAPFSTTALSGFEQPLEGKAGLGEDGSFIFTPRDPANPPIILAPAQVEIATTTGFPARTLVVTLLNGKMYEFTAGYFFTNSSAKHVARQLSARRK